MHIRITYELCLLDTVILYQTDFEFIFILKQIFFLGKVSSVELWISI